MQMKKWRVSKCFNACTSGATQAKTIRLGPKEGEQVAIIISITGIVCRYLDQRGLLNCLGLS